MSNGIEFEFDSGLNLAQTQSDSSIIRWMMKTFPSLFKEEKQAYRAVVVTTLAVIALSLFFIFKEDARPYQPSQAEMFRVTPTVSAPLQ